MIKGSQNSESTFSLKVGVDLLKPIFVNPSLIKLQEIYPTKTNDPIYCHDSRQDKEGNTFPQVDIVVYFTDSSGQIVNKFFSIVKKYRLDKNGIKYQWRNDAGNTTWAKSIEDIEIMSQTAAKDGARKMYRNFLAKNPAKCYEGEAALLDFLQKVNNLNPQAPECEVSINLKKIFNGDFREIEADIMAGKDLGVVGVLEVNTKIIPASANEETGEIIPESFKEYQSVYSTFLPGNYLSLFDPNVYSNNSFGKSQVEKFKNDIVGDFGSKNFIGNKKAIFKLEEKIITKEDYLKLIDKTKVKITHINTPLSLVHNYDSLNNPAINGNTNTPSDPVDQSNDHVPDPEGFELPF